MVLGNTTTGATAQKLNNTAFPPAPNSGITSPPPKQQQPWAPMVAAQRLQYVWHMRPSRAQQHTTVTDSPAVHSQPLMKHSIATVNTAGENNERAHVAIISKGPAHLPLMPPTTLTTKRHHGGSSDAVNTTRVRLMQPYLAAVHGFYS
jgi:hypothetical protein